MKRPQLPEDLPAQVRCEAGPDLAGKPQLPSVVEADEQRVDAVRSRAIASNDELLLAIELQLDPGTAAYAGLIT